MKRLFFVAALLGVIVARCKSYDATDTGDAGGPPPPSDSGVTEGGADASTDDADAGATSFCGKIYFRDDFEGAGFPSPWDGVTSLGANGTITSDANGRGGGHALHVQMPADAGSARYVTSSAPFPPSGRVCISLFVKLTSPTQGFGFADADYADLVVVNLMADAKSRVGSFGMGIRNGGAYAYYSDGVTVKTLPVPGKSIALTGAWQNVILLIDVGKQTISAAFPPDGILDATDFTISGAPTNAAVFVGAETSGTTPAIDVGFDDFVAGTP